MRANRETAVIAPEQVVRELDGPALFLPITFNDKLALQAKAPTSSWRTPRQHPIRPYVSATYVSIRATCSEACPYKGTPTERSTCYGDASITRQIVQRLDVLAAGLSSLQVIQFEVKLIDGAENAARDGRDLRLHVTGDVGSLEGALLLAACAHRWRVRGGGVVWTYTHNWREIPRKAWGDAINVFASVENDEDMARARKRGYAPARVVDAFPNGTRPFLPPGSSTKIMPCRFETERMPCAECRLCLDHDLHDSNIAIGFKLRHAKVEEPLVKLRVAG